MPDADFEMTTRILADSGFGCAGQRCLAAAVAITVGEAKPALTEQLVEAARARKVGYGLDPGVEMGPVISAPSQARIETLIARGEREGANLLVDGRGRKVEELRRGLLRFSYPAGRGSARGGDRPYRGLRPGAESDARRLASRRPSKMVNARSYGNMACIFTRDEAVRGAFATR